MYGAHQREDNLRNLNMETQLIFSKWY